MTETRSSQKPGPGDSGIFSVGNPLNPLRGGYVRRPADDALYNCVASGHYAHVIAPANCGKSSLVAAAAARLRNNGFKVATLDLSQIAERDGGTDAGRWYYSIAYRLLRQLRLKIDLQDWWQDKAILSNRQRLVEFYIEVILQNIREPVVVFVDEIQAVENLPFKEHLLPSIRAAHNARSTDPDFERLVFVMCGEGDPDSLVDDPALSPFRVSQAVNLPDLTRPDLDIFVNELNLSGAEARQALDRVWHWTGGQPYLTQKLCRALARETVTGDVDAAVDRIVMKLLAGRAALHSEPHMQHIHRRIVNDTRDAEAMLNTYGALRKGLETPWEPESRPQRKLLAAGLVQVNDAGLLQPANRLYEAVFTARWANQNLPLHWRGPAAIAAGLVLLLALPFWYTQLLPKPYMRTLVSPTADLATVEVAWRNLRSFPGHGDTADRLYVNLLENRARRAPDREAITAIAASAAAMPAEDDLADRLHAEFWDRERNRAMRAERRDDALVAALEALRVATPERRRAAAALVGDDYPLLVASLATAGQGRLAWNAGEMLLTRTSGARVMQWSLADDRLVARDPWTLSALEVTPLVRRVAVDRQAEVARIGLSVNVSHARLNDLRLKLIAPSGRTVELAFGEGRSSARDVTVFPAAELRSLVGESLAGTWSLSLRDEATGVNGHLVGWELGLNSQVLVEDFDRGLDIPPPVERESDNIWIGADGRFAVARALQSDSARLWDLAGSRPMRTLAVPANETVIGVGDDGRQLVVTLAQDDLHLWRVANGRREAVLEGAAAGADVRLTADRQRLFVARRGEPESRFSLWSLAGGERIATLSIAGSPALIAIDAAGRRLAVADYDRAVRVWDLENGRQLAQLDLHAPASAMDLAPDGLSLAVLHGEQGISLWRTDDAAEPLLVDRGPHRWQLAYSPGGERLLAGSPPLGYRVYRASDGALLGPSLDAGAAADERTLLGFSRDEDYLLTVAGESARIWRRPTDSETPGGPAGRAVSGHGVWRASGDSPSALAPGGRYLAVADREGHVHLLDGRAGGKPIAARVDEVNYLGHQGPVLALEFSRDGALVASVGTDGSLRVWDSATGRPRPFAPDVVRGRVTGLEFSADASRIAVLSGQRIAVVDAGDGRVLADLDLGEAHTSLAFAADGLLYLAAERGALKSLAPDRVGSFSLTTVWRGDASLEAIAAAQDRPLLTLAYTDGRVRLLDLQHGRLGNSGIALPSPVSEMTFAPGGTRVVLRTPGWVHRASVSTGGLQWLDSLRAPRGIAGARPVVDHIATANGDKAPDPQADRLLVLTRNSGFAEVAELDFEFESGPLLFGTREALLTDWRKRLGRTPPAPVSSDAGLR